MARADSVMTDRKIGRVLSQSLREEGMEGRARSERRVIRGPSLGFGAAINVRRVGRRERKAGRHAVEHAGHNRGGILKFFM